MRQLSKCCSPRSGGRHQRAGRQGRHGHRVAINKLKTARKHLLKTDASAALFNGKRALREAKKEVQRRIQGRYNFETYVTLHIIIISNKSSQVRHLQMRLPQISLSVCACDWRIFTAGIVPTYPNLRNGMGHKAAPGSTAVIDQVTYSGDNGYSIRAPWFHHQQI